MKNLTLENIAKACGGTYIGSGELAKKEVTSITTDSRKVEGGSLFVPIVGARADGHDYIEDVMKKGALCTLSEKELPDVQFPYIKINSSLQAVKDLAEFYLKQLQIPVVGITGSVGKTSTKEAIAAVLETKYQVLKTQGNFNNELGLPLTVFRLREEDEIAVLEMGISDFGEMTRLAKIARPDTCVITNIGQCHLEFLGDRDGILRAKTEVFDFVKDQGHIILNGDDDKLCTVGTVRGIEPVFFGMDASYPIYATDVVSQGLKGIGCRIHMGEESFEVLIPIPGQHMVYNALAATAVGRTYGLKPEQIRRGLESLKPTAGRFHMIETDKLLIVDDCYNASPASMEASLEILKDALGRKVAILGDMGELGEEEDALHARVGAFAAQQQVDLLICVGEHSVHMAEAAQEQQTKTQVVHFSKKQDLLPDLTDYMQEGDTVLVKASHFMQFGEIVEALKKY